MKNMSTKTVNVLTLSITAVVAVLFLGVAFAETEAESTTALTSDRSSSVRLDAKESSPEPLRAGPRAEVIRQLRATRNKTGATPDEIRRAELSADIMAAFDHIGKTARNARERIIMVDEFTRLNRELLDELGY